MLAKFSAPWPRMPGDSLGRGIVGAAGGWTPGDPRGLWEPWVQPAPKGAGPAHQGRCQAGPLQLPSRAFSAPDSVGGRRWGRGFSCHLDLGVCPGSASSQALGASVSAGVK